MSDVNYDEAVKRATGYSKAELDAAWDLVKPATHWKDPINALIDPDKRDAVAAAVEFFTATKAVFVEFVNDYKLWVTAVGYRAGPAGDH